MSIIESGTKQIVKLRACNTSVNLKQEDWSENANILQQYIKSILSIFIGLSPNMCQTIV